MLVSKRARGWLGLGFVAVVVLAFFFGARAFDKFRVLKAQSDQLDLMQTLPRTVFLLEAPAPKIEFCRLPCEQIGEVISRMNDFISSRFVPDHKLAEDPAFQFAQLLQRAQLGPEGRRQFSVIHRFQERPIHWRSYEVLPLVYAVAFRQDAQKKRAEARAIGAAVFLDRLSEAGQSCHKNTWPSDCLSLQAAVDGWVANGALH